MMNLFKGALVCAALTAFSSTAMAQATPYIQLDTNANGSIITTNSPNYSSPPASWTVTARIHNITSANVNSYRVNMNGAPASLVPDPNHPFAVATGAVGLVSNAQRLENVLKPIVIELTDANGVMLDVEKYVMYDLRADSWAVPIKSGPLNREVGTQITPDAIDKLAEVHQSSLPPGGQLLFENLVLGPAEALTPSVVLPTGILDFNRICVNVEDYPELKASAAYDRALLEAGFAHLAYLAAPDPTGGLIKGTVGCVKEIPTASNFIACFGNIQLDEPQFDALSVDRVNLRLPATPGEIQASAIDIDPITGTVDALLRDVAIIWDEGSIFCVGRPRATITEDDLADDPALEAWSTCEDVDLHIHGASAGGGSDFTFAPGANPEEVDFVQVTPATFTLNGTDTDAAKGVCADVIELQDEITTLAQDTYYDTIRDNLTSAWASGGQDVALEALFSTLESGAAQPLGFDVVHLFQQHTSNVDIDNNLATDLGMLSWMTSSVLDPSGGGTTYFYSRPNADFLWEDQGTDFWGADYDIWYGITTGAMNQVISPVGHTRLDFVWGPTWDELGLNPADFGYAGSAGSDIAVLDAAVLTAMDPELADITDPIEIHVRPTLQPFTWMNPDPSPYPGDGNFKMSYELGQVMVTITDTTTNKPLYVFAVDVIDPEFQVSFDADSGPGEHFLAGGFSARKTTTFTLVDTDDAKCWTPGVNCGDVAMGFANLLGPHIDTLLLETVGDIPAPSYWDAAGSASRPKRLVQTEKYQHRQLVTLYGELVDP